MAWLIGVAPLAGLARAAGTSHGERAGERACGDESAAHALVAAFEERFTTIEATSADELERLYARDVRFTDPITTVRGTEQLAAYLTAFAGRVEDARFRMDGRVVEPDQAVVFWTMTRPGDDGEAEQQVAGVSHLRFADGRIAEERDYFDLGAAVYEQVPVVGWLTGLVDGALEPELPEAAERAGSSSERPVDEHPGAEGGGRPVLP